MQNNFINLRTYTDYSIGKSIIRIDEIIKYCIKNKIKAIAIADHNNLFGSLEFSLSCQKQGIQPIIGVTITIKFHSKHHSEYYSDVLLIASTSQGYQNMIYLVSQLYIDKKLPYINCSDLYNRMQGLILICGQYNSPTEILYNANLFHEAEYLIQDFKKIFRDNFFLEIARPKNYNVNYEKFLLYNALNLNIPIVSTNLAQYIEANDFITLETYICINQGKYLDKTNIDKNIKSNHLKNYQEIDRMFSDIPESIRNTQLVSQKCSFLLSEKKADLPKYKEEYQEEIRIITEKSNTNLKKILKAKKIKDEQIYFKRLHHELSIINNMKFAGYFLIVADFVNWSKKNSIPVGAGRGSGVGSIVAWSLGICDIDPIKFDLVFERFLNPERTTMPDFDIDFCQEQRDKVIEYVTKKFGKDRVAHIITFGKLQARAVLRDVGRVLQIPYTKVNSICKLIPNNPAHPVTLKEAITLDKNLYNESKIDPAIEELIKISLSLEGLNRHIAKHAAGIIIDNRSIILKVPLYTDNESKIPIVQYSLKYVEKIGLVKFDFLGLKTLTTINDTLNIIYQNKEKKINISTISTEDYKTYKMLGEGKSIGVFQYESSGMRNAIEKMKPDCIEDLVALGSLYRPGPMDNIPKYINRKHHIEGIEYIDHKLENILKETYGIIIYQEQVMKIAQILAGYSLGEADILRRAMGKKIRSEMEEQRNKFISGCKNKNITQNVASKIFNLISKFASYGFNKSHAVAYAFISYQTAYLKANHTIEFIVASLNLEITRTDKILLFLNEAKQFKIGILPPDINQSIDIFTIENRQIRFGLLAIKGVGKNVIDKIINTRKKLGKFINIYNFLISIDKNTINKKLLNSLIKSGALDCFKYTRNTLLNNIEHIIKYANNIDDNNRKQLTLFSNKNYYSLIIIKKQEITEEEKLQYEFEVLGFYLSSTPLIKYAHLIKMLNITTSNQIKNINTTVNIIGTIANKRVKSTNKGKYVFLQVLDLNGIIDVAIFDENIFISNMQILQEGHIIHAVIRIINNKGKIKKIIQKVDTICEILNQSLQININIKNLKDLDILAKNINTEKGIAVFINILIEKFIVHLKSNKTIYLNYKKSLILKKKIEIVYSKK